MCEIWAVVPKNCSELQVPPALCPSIEYVSFNCAFAEWLTPMREPILVGRRTLLATCQTYWNPFEVCELCSRSDWRAGFFSIPRNSASQIHSILLLLSGSRNCLMWRWTVHCKDGFVASQSEWYHSLHSNLSIILPKQLCFFTVNSEHTSVRWAMMCNVHWAMSM